VVANGRIFYGNGDEILAYSTSTGDFLWRYMDSNRPDDRQYDLVATSNDLIVSQGEW
jgi:outer membrane protein assembly factor BamB